MTTKHRSRPQTIDDVERLLDDRLAARELLSDDGELKRIQVICHPDKHPGDVARATRVFQRVQDLATKPTTPRLLVKSPKRTYELGSLLAVGDVADVYEAIGEGRPYVVKISRVPGSAELLENERAALAKIITAAGDSIYRHAVPLLVESFRAGSRRVNVFAPLADVYSLERLLQMFPEGLRAEHMVWIGKRLLTAIGFFHLQKIVHGAIVPSHILVHPSRHTITVCGFGQSVDSGHRIKSIAAKYKDLYPREVFDKKPATAETDVFMAAKCLELLVGKQPLPAGLQSSLRACLMERQSMRPGDAWVVHDDLSDMAERVYGPPAFVPLVV